MTVREKQGGHRFTSLHLANHQLLYGRELAAPRADRQSGGLIAAAKSPSHS
jgi:hypothetical protein